jgi:mRNA-degrading endonuclease RelE of RelBE toxin-antitoxin system
VQPFQSQRTPEAVPVLPFNARLNPNNAKCLTKILVCSTTQFMGWKVALKDSVLEDLRWFGRKDGRLILEAPLEILENDPLHDSRNLKTLRQNAFAERELLISGKYRILFNVDRRKQLVIIMAVGEKRGNKLFVQGEEYIAHHENRSSE